MKRKISLQAAKHFILAKQGLLNDHRFYDKQGVLDFVEQAGCLQFDPIDICGRNPDLVLFSRVKNYQKTMLDTLLYEERKLVDQWDKNMSIYSVKDWDKLAPRRAQNAKSYETHLGEHKPLIDTVATILKESPYVTAADLEISGNAEFFTWRHNKLANALLEYLFFKGDAVVHHREGVKRFFADVAVLDKDIIEQMTHPNDAAFKTFMIQRRIGALGLIGDCASDAYLGIGKLPAQQRKDILKQLVEAEVLIEYEIEGQNGSFYGLQTDEHYFEHAYQQKRLEFIGPLDSFIWDRKLIKKLFDFEYKWEIYTPANQRKYAAYVLPILYGDNLVARIEMAVDRKSKMLKVKNIWFENQMLDNDFMDLLTQKLQQFATFNNCVEVDSTALNIHLDAK